MNKDGKIFELPKELKDEYDNKTNNNHELEKLTPLSNKEHRVLKNKKEASRPAELAWMRLYNKYLPPKLMFIAGFEAAKKIYNGNE